MRKFCFALPCAGFLFSIFACSFLFAPVAGRYNPSDPQNEIPTVELVPTADGWVESTPGADFSQTILWINNASTIATPIMRFDRDDLPANVVSAELHLWISVSATADTEIHAHPILEQWSPSSISDASDPWMVVQDGSFFDPAIMASIVVLKNAHDVYVVLDLTEVYERMIEAGNHGIYLECTASAMNLHSSRAANPPKLRITGYD